MDATEDANKDLASKFGVQGFPTLKVCFLMPSPPRMHQFCTCPIVTWEISLPSLRMSREMLFDCFDVHQGIGSGKSRVLQIFRGGDANAAQEYKGPRDADGIIKYLEKKSQPASSVLETKEKVMLLALLRLAVPLWDSSANVKYGVEDARSVNFCLSKLGSGMLYQDLVCWQILTSFSHHRASNWDTGSTVYMSAFLPPPKCDLIFPSFGLRCVGL